MLLHNLETDVAGDQLELHARVHPEEVEEHVVQSAEPQDEGFLIAAT